MQKEFEEDIFPIDDLQGIIQTIVDNLSKLAKLIMMCVDSLQEERTRLGLTSMSVKVKYGYVWKSIFKGFFLKNVTEIPNCNTADEEYNLGKFIGVECKAQIDYGELPEEFSWLDEGYVTSVKNQGSCGSCYVFAALAALESQYLINGGREEIDLSEQVLVNCVNGCDGGHSSNAFDYIVKYGIASEKDFPYVGKVQIYFF